MTVACQEKEPVGTTTAAQKGPDAQASRAAGKASGVGTSPSVVSSSGVAGELRLVKTADSSSVFVIKDGKKSAISNWGWVELNAPGKPVETVSQAELDSYGDTGITYK
jgi:hypothetical protein